MNYYITQVGRKLINEFKAPSIRGTLAGAQSTAGGRIGGSSGKSSVGSSKGQDPNWNSQQKKEISGMMGRYKSKVVGDLEHKFGRYGGREGERWANEPQSLGPHQLDAWRKTARSGKVVPANRGETGAWNAGDDEAPNWQRWVSTNPNPKRFSAFKGTQGEKPDPRWPGVTSTDPYGDYSNREILGRLARRKGSGDDPHKTYRGPGDTVSPTYRPTPDKAQVIRDNPSNNPLIAQMKSDLDTSDRMSHADKFDPEKQRQQQLARVSDVMRQQRDVKKNVNFSDFKPELSARLRHKWSATIRAGEAERAAAKAERAAADRKAKAIINFPK